MFLKILQYSKEDTCIGVSFNKVASFRPATSLKKTPTQMLYCKYCEIFKKSFLYRTPPVVASNSYRFFRKSLCKHFVWFNKVLLNLRGILHKILTFTRISVSHVNKETFCAAIFYHASLTHVGQGWPSTWKARPTDY